MAVDKQVVVVTERGTMDRDTEAVTPPGMPNLEVRVMMPAARIVVRTIRVYLMTFVGLLGAVTADAAIAPVDFHLGWGRVALAATTAVFPAFVSFIWNMIELMAEWDKTHPQLRG